LRPLGFLEARAVVLKEARAASSIGKTETVPLSESQGRILAEDIAADRDYPPFNRSMRDGFAVRASEIPGTLRVVGEVRAGTAYQGVPAPGEAVEIMTGAPVPAGLDAVVMVEHCTRDSDDGFTTDRVTTDRALVAGANIAPRGSEAPAGQIVISRGKRIDYATVSLLATTGHSEVKVFEKLRVAILATGDELVGIDEQPAPHQIRNSNAISLAAQVTRAGCVPVLLPVARDVVGETRRLVEEGLHADLLLLSGGVSAGRYDVVEPALAQLGAEFFFDRVLIQPGQPLVFGRVRGKFFFGLPGNPGATMVTFELFVRAALELLSGASETSLPLALARLTRPFKHKTGLTRFLPATLCDGRITPVDWQGSGDVPSYSRANCYLVAEVDHAEYAEGDLIQVLLK
jgi:molybdopterin molybdotransferase